MSVSTKHPVPVNPKAIAIIGAGGIVTDSHLPAYRKADFTVLALYDRDKQKAKNVAEQWHISHCCDTLEDLIARGAQESCVFDIAVPASEILTILQKLPARAGVLIQKPMGESLAQAQAILDCCRQKGLIAGSNFQLRRAPFMMAAKQLVTEGKLGDIHDVEMRVICQTPWSLWQFLYEKERMEVNYHSIHYIDVIRYFLGDPQAVYCKTMKHPKLLKLAQTRSSNILDYGDIVRANIHTNHGHDYAPDKQECFFKIEGTRGAIKIQIGVILN